jgi:hypothetical protein
LEDLPIGWRMARDYAGSNARIIAGDSLSVEKIHGPTSEFSFPDSGRQKARPLHVQTLTSRISLLVPPAEHTAARMSARCHHFTIIF